jgi:hypothetical protein
VANETAVSLTVPEAMRIHDALAHARRHLAHRDQMNAELHLDSTRWSNLTTLVATAEDTLTSVLQDQAIIGAPLQHAAHPGAGDGQA